MFIRVGIPGTILMSQANYGRSCMQCVGRAEIKGLYVHRHSFACNSETQAAKQMAACTAATSTISSPTAKDTGVFSISHKLLLLCCPLACVVIGIPN